MHSISGAAAATPACDDAGRSGDDLGGEPAADEHEAERVLGGGEESGDVEQRVVHDAVAEQRARRGHRAEWCFSPKPQSH